VQRQGAVGGSSPGATGPPRWASSARTSTPTRTASSRSSRAAIRARASRDSPHRKSITTGRGNGRRYADRVVDHTFATLRVRATETLDFHAGFDNRRNVLLYRDVVNPVTTFDDAFRQGVWVGMGVRIASRYFIAADTRQSAGGAAGRASSIPCPWWPTG